MNTGEARHLTSELVRALAAAHPIELAAVIERTLMGLAGVDAVGVWLADMGYHQLRRLGTDEVVEVTGSLAGRAFRERSIVEGEERLLGPIDSSGRVFGVLELRGPSSHDAADVILELGNVIADRLLGSRGHSDVIEVARGADQLDVAATIQHELLPIPSFVDDNVEIGGQIEPAYDIAGDGFDYAVNDGAVYVAVFDAVGHGLRSALLTSVAVGTFRLHRRRGDELASIVAAIEGTLNHLTSPGEFVTGVIGRLDPATRKIEVSIAGHLPPLVVRNGHCHEVDIEPIVPFGLGRMGVRTVETRLEPGDAMYIYSDGIVEAYNADRNPFGEEALIALLGQHERDGTSVQRVCGDVLSSVVTHVGDRLRDDATILGIRTAS